MFVGDRAFKKKGEIMLKVKVLAATAGLAFASAALAQANDPCAGAISVLAGSDTPFDTTLATTDGASSCGAGATDIWYTYTATDTGLLTVSCCGASYDSVISIIDFDCAGIELACNDDFCGVSSTVSTSVTLGQVVMIRVAGFNGGSGTGTLHVQQDGSGGLANDACADAIAVLAGSDTAFSTSAATNDGSSSCGAGANDIWYTYTATDTGLLTASCCGATYDSVISIIDTDCFGLELVCNDDSCGLSSSASTSVTLGQVVMIRVAGYGGGVGSGTLHIQQDGPPPPADDLPASAQVPAGSGSLASLDGSLGVGDAADMFKFTICDYVNFTASTVGNPAVQDTQLFLFDELGNAVQMNDDTPAGGTLQSSMGAEFVLANGTYFIAVSHYDNDPNNAIPAAIWADTPFNVVRAPDGGHGGDLQPASWDTANVTSFAYSIALTGACYFEAGGCGADFNGDTIVDFFDYLDFVDAFSTGC